MAALGALGTLALLVIVGERGALRVVWSRFGVAESIAGFRRARDDELGAEARARAPEFQIGRAHV